MNVENIIAAAQRAYKHCLISWNREVIIAASDVVPGAIGDIRIIVCKTAGGPAVTYRLGSRTNGGFSYAWNSPSKSARLKVARWTEKACEVAFRDAILNAESVCKELIGAK